MPPSDSVALIAEAREETSHAPQPHVRVAPSAIYELCWALLRIKRARDRAEPQRLNPTVNVSSRLARRVAEFWGDGCRLFFELAVLAHWMSATYDSDPIEFLACLERGVPDPRGRELGLVSERPDERAAYATRIARLHAEPELRATYVAVLRDVWQQIAPVWRARGIRELARAADEWRVRIAHDGPLRSLLPRTQAVFAFNLEPLLDAAIARGDAIVLTPLLLGGGRAGHIVDVVGELSLGVPIEEETVTRFACAGQSVHATAHVLVGERRAAILSRLFESPATLGEIVADTGFSVRSVRASLARLRTVALVERRTDQCYAVAPAQVEFILNEVSQGLQGQHGRSVRQHAKAVAEEASFLTIFEHAPIAILQLDLEGRILACNPAAERMFAYTAAEFGQLRGRHLVADEADADTFGVAGAASLDERRELRLRSKDGSTFWGSLTVSLVRGPEDSPLFGYAMIENVGERRGGEDTVTRLPNRALFLSRLERTLGVCRRDGEGFALFMIDLDRFKPVNDTFGHDAGDELLRLVSARLGAAVRADDIVARLGGDEFAVLAPGAAVPEAVARIAEKLRAALDAPFVLSGDRVVRIGGSIGSALAPADGESVDALMKAADERMYVAKAEAHATRAA